MNTSSTREMFGTGGTPEQVEKPQVSAGNGRPQPARERVEVPQKILDVLHPLLEETVVAYKNERGYLDYACRPPFALKNLLDARFLELKNDWNAKKQGSFFVFKYYDKDAGGIFIVNENWLLEINRIMLSDAGKTPQAPVKPVYKQEEEGEKRADLTIAETMVKAGAYLVPLLEKCKRLHADLEKNDLIAEPEDVQCAREVLQHVEEALMSLKTAGMLFKTGRNRNKNGDFFTRGLTGQK